MTQPSTVDLFELRILESRLHPNFTALRKSPFHGHARAFINELYARMGQIDRTFIDEFQGAGFHNRVFEIACFAYLEAAGFAFDRTHSRPDFVASRDALSLVAEVTSANPPDGREIDISISAMAVLPQSEIARKATLEFPKRIASSLSRKLNKYGDLAHCRGKPFVLMVAPLFEPGAPFYVDDSLVPCFFGLGREDWPAESPRPFFEMKGAEQVSAVLYANGYTVSRLFRAVTPCGPNHAVSGYLEGWHCRFSEDGGLDYGRFRYPLGPDAPPEPWSQGVTMFINPNAVHPLPPDSLPCSCVFRMENGEFRRQIFGFHPLLTFMRIWPTAAPGNEG